MKKFKFLPLFLIICLLFAAFPAPQALALSDPGLSSPEPGSSVVPSVVVIDRNTGEEFYTLNPDQIVYPASTTKIMTVLLAVEAIEAEKVSIYDEVTAGESMAYDLVADGSSAGIMVGETMSLENLLYCAMVSSANEACNIIAENIGGTISDFIGMMNARAKELGCTYTHFANTHGLPDSNHYTTARDYSLIAAEAARHDLFMAISSTPKVTIPATNMSGQRELKNSNALICDESIYGRQYLYEYATSGKTGHTNAAGYCLVSTATNGNIDLIAVVFGGRAYTGEDGTACYTNFEDSIKLYEWVFNNFSYQDVLKSTEIVASVPVTMGADADSVNLRPDRSITALLPNDCNISAFKRTVVVTSLLDGKELVAPVSAGEVLGSITVTDGDINYGTVKLVASSSVELSRLQYMKNELNKTLHSKPVKIAVITIVSLLLIYLILVIRYRIIHLRRRRAVRLQRQEQARLSKANAGQQKRLASEQQRTAESRPETPPQISYFDRNGTVSNPETPAPAHVDAESEEARKAKADRDYFEEFFRQK